MKLHILLQAFIDDLEPKQKSILSAWFKSQDPDEIYEMFLKELKPKRSK